MKYTYPQFQSQLGWCLYVIILINTTSASAQIPNFATLKLSSSMKPIQQRVSGVTGGIYSLSTIRGRDNNKNACIGFAESNPDYILVLEENFNNLTILVKSGGEDTTLLIKGPEEEIVRCGDDTGKSKDASISDKKWTKGTYQIWVGIFEPGLKRNYTLTVQE
ncbi:MAG: hypothetical protein RLZZ86_2494 [Cyanobacteriota bacterium]|jgi:hypothetical protein